MASNFTMPDESLDEKAEVLLMNQDLFSGGPYTYRAYGLTFSSEMHFPQWPEAPASAEADVHIGQGVIFGRDYTPPSSVQIESSPDSLLLRGSRTATILVSGGNAITVELLPRPNPVILRQLLQGWALAGIFHQRGMLPLHGSAVCDKDACFVVCAASGTGKSTLAVAFLNAGYAYLDDNIAVIEYQEDVPFVAPGIPEIRLWEDALPNVAFEHTVSGRVKPEVNKLAVLARTNFRSSPAILKRIFILRRTQDTKLSFVPLTGAAKFQALWEHVFCVRFMGNTGGKAGLFRNLQALASRAALVEIRLPATLPEPDALCRMIREA
jgi:hypothetical protein